MTDTKKQQIDAMINAAQAIAAAIKDLGSVPSGHLYANVAGHMGLSQYTQIINLLKAGKMITESNHVLTWVG